MNTEHKFMGTEHTGGMGHDVGHTGGIASEETQSELMKKGQDMYEKTGEAVTQAYDKTAETVTQTYDQVKGYAYQNPEKMMLIAFGIGVGVGLLLASRRSTPASRYAQPFVDVAYDMARSFLK